MSMPALLSHFGIDAARYVTTTGEVVFGGVQSSGGVFTHSTHGSVTPVSPHTFHGGEEPGDQSDSPTPWWDDEDQVRRHVEAMTRSFPAFVYFPAEDGAPPFWAGEINTGRGRFRIGVLLRHDRGLPTVKVLNGPQLGISAGRGWIDSPHLYLSGNLCVADRDDWDPDQHSAATVTAWAAHWLAAYTEWRISRRWPTEGVLAVAS